MANIVEQTPNTADKAISLLDSNQFDEKITKKFDYSSVRGKVIYFKWRSLYFLHKCN